MNTTNLLIDIIKILKEILKQQRKINTKLKEIEEIIGGENDI